MQIGDKFKSDINGGMKVTVIDVTCLNNDFHCENNMLLCVELGCF